MNRTELTSLYKIDDAGRIRSPGQFEGEMIYVPYFWDTYLDGFADRDDGHVLGFDVTTEDKAEFPELRRRRTVRLIQRDDGFVCEV
jgi:hypothetical protein